MKSVIEIEKAFIKKINDKIICLEFKDGVDFELEDAEETDKAYYELCEGKPFCSLIDARVYGSISSEARAFFAHDDLVKDIRIAEAFVITSLGIRMLAKFYIQFNRPDNPVKIFSNTKDATNWLEEMYNARIGQYQFEKSNNNQA